MLLALFVALTSVGAAPKGLSREQLTGLNRVRYRIADELRSNCEKGECLNWDPRARSFRFTGKDVLTRGLFEEQRLDPWGARWTDAALARMFPEFSPDELALTCLKNPTLNLWEALVRWLAEDPRRLSGYPGEPWGAFAGARPELIEAGVSSPFHRPFQAADLEYLGMSLNALKAAVTVLRCDTLVEKALAVQKQTHAAVPKDLLKRWARDGTVEHEWLVDAWGWPIWMKDVGGSGGQQPLSERRQYGAYVHGFAFISAGPDGDPGDADDFGCGEMDRLDGPPRIPGYNYRKIPRGQYDDLIDAAIILEQTDPHRQ